MASIKNCLLFFSCITATSLANAFQPPAPLPHNLKEADALLAKVTRMKKFHINCIETLKQNGTPTTQQETQRAIRCNQNEIENLQKYAAQVKRHKDRFMRDALDRLQQ